jgi:uncharacterized protein
VTETDRAGRTGLHHAAADGDIERASVLIASGVDPGLGDSMGWTPLHFAAQGGHSEIAALLIDAGAAVDPEDKFGNTPLWRAVFESKGDGSVINVLRARGADPQHANHSNVSPVALARTIANYDVAGFFTDVEQK